MKQYLLKNSLRFFIKDAVDLEKKYRDLEKSLNAGSGDTASDASDEVNDDDVEIIEEEDDPLYCVGCDKRFKSFPAMRNHVQSKQHKKNMELLRAELEDEETLDGLAEDFEQLNAAVADDAGDSDDSPNPASTKNLPSAADKRTPTPPAEEEAETLVVLAAAEPVIAVEEYTSRNKSKKDKKAKVAQKKIQELGLKCAVCREVFPTRNKLFQHVKAENHATPK